MGIKGMGNTLLENDNEISRQWEEVSTEKRFLVKREMEGPFSEEC